MIDFNSTYIRKKSVYLFFLFIIGYVLSSNYIYFPHLQDGKDTYFYMLTAKMILNKHYIPWIFHFTSYFGLYPFSVPPGAQTLLAALYSLSEAGGDLTIIIIGDVMFIFTSLLVFLISHKITSNILLSMFFSFVAINMPSFFNWLWNAFSSRILFYLLFLFWLLFLIILNKKTKQDLKTFSITICSTLLFGVFLYTIHRSAFLLVLMTTIFLINIAIKKLIEKTKYKQLFKYVIFVLLIFSLIFPFYNNLHIDGYNGEYYSHGFIKGDSSTVQLLNFVLSIGAGSGIVLFFISLMLILKLFFYQRKLSMFDVFSFSFLSTLLILSPAGLYVRCIIGIAFLIISIDISSKFGMIFKLKIMDIKKVFVILIIVLILNNIYMQQYWITNKIEKSTSVGRIMTEKAYMSALYVNNIISNNQSIVVDSWYLNRWIQSHASVASLPPPLGMNSEINYAVYFRKNISAHPISFWEFITDSKKSMGHHYIYYSEDYLKPPMDYIKLMNHPPDTNISIEITNKYNTKYALKDLHHKNKYLFWGDRWVDSKFYKNLSSDRYKIYSNDDIAIYLI